MCFTGVRVLNRLPWKEIPNERHAIITKLPPRVTLALEHVRPALVGERYSLALRVTSDEAVEMTDIKLSLSVSENSEPFKAVITDDNGGAAALASEMSWELEPLASGGSAVRPVLLTFDKVCGVDLIVALTYSTRTTTNVGVAQVWEHARELHEVLQATWPVSSLIRLEAPDHTVLYR
jgi:hypothetical protein